MFSHWLTGAAASLSPASLTVAVDSGATPPQSSSTIHIIGDAAETNVEATVELTGAPTAWRQDDVSVTASLKSHDAMGMARQSGSLRLAGALDRGEREEGWSAVRDRAYAQP